MTPEFGNGRVHPLDTPEAVMAYLQANPAQHQLCACDAWDSFCAEDGWFAMSPLLNDETRVVPQGSAAQAWLEAMEGRPHSLDHPVVAWAPWWDVWSLPAAQGTLSVSPSPRPEEGV